MLITLKHQQDIIDRKSQFNFGAEYEVSKGFRLGAYYLYGSEIGVNAQIQFNPNRPQHHLI